MVPEKLRKPFLPNRLDQGTPLTLKGFEVGRQPDAREQVGLEQIGRGQLQSTGIQWREHGVRVQIVVDGDQDEKELTAHRFGRDLRKHSSVGLENLHFVEPSGKVAEALPKKPIRFRK